MKGLLNVLLLATLAVMMSVTFSLATGMTVCVYWR